MVAMTNYTVTAERGQGQTWVFQCAEHPGAISESPRLADAQRLMTEAIAFVAEVDPDTIEINLVPQLPAHLEGEIKKARQAVHDLKERQRIAAALSRKVVIDLKAAELTGSDIATVLNISPQRVSQLIRS